MGRGSELDEVEAGSLSTRFDNRGRQLDPTFQGAIANLISNPSFETNLTGYTLESTFAPTTAARSQEWFSAGGWSYKVQDAAFGAGGHYAGPRYDGIPAVAGTAYSARARVKVVTAPGTGGIQMRMDFKNGGGGLISNAFSSVIPGAGEFDVAILGAVAPATTATISLVVVLVNNGGAPAAGLAYFDAYMVTESASTSVVPDYVDGDYPNGRWAGTRHASQSYLGGPFYPNVKPQRRIRLRYMRGRSQSRAVLNRLDNGSFEQGDIKWTKANTGGGGAVTIDSHASDFFDRTGTGNGWRAQAKSNSVSPATASIQSQGFYVDPSKYRYLLTAYIRSIPGVLAQNAELSIKWYAKDGTLIIQTYPDAAVAGTTLTAAPFNVANAAWGTRYGGLYTKVPGGAAYGIVEFVFYRNTGAVDAGTMVDAIMLEEIPVAVAAAGMNPSAYDDTEYTGAWCGSFGGQGAGAHNGGSVGGYIDTVKLEWPDRLFAGEVQIEATDPFKILSGSNLPDYPPFHDVILFDKPRLYYPLQEILGFAPIGTTIENEGSFTNAGVVTGAGNMFFGVGPIVAGDPDGQSSAPFTGGGRVDSGDRYAGNMTVEAMVWHNANPVRTQVIVAGPVAIVAHGAVACFDLSIFNTNQARFFVHCANNTNAIAVSAVGTIVPSAYYHLLGTWDDATRTASLYINGVLAASAVGTAVMATPDTLAAGSQLSISSATANDPANVAHVAQYQSVLSASRITYHAAAVFAGRFAERSDLRIMALLTRQSGIFETWFAPTGLRTVEAAHFNGQSVLGEAQAAAQAEGGIFFFGREGHPKVLPRDWKTAYTVYSASQATFGDGAGELPYEDVTIDYSESFLINTVEVTRKAQSGTLQRATDATSVSEYMERVRTYDGLLVTSDADALSHAQLIRDRFKDPKVRILSLSFSPDMDATGELRRLACQLDLFFQVTVNRRPKGLSTGILSQASQIERIHHHGSLETGEWTVEYGVSPR